MRERKPKPSWKDQFHWSNLAADGLLWLFLIGGWLLILGAAMLGLQRTPQQWLPINLVAQVSADYGETNTLKLARVDPRIIEAIKQDAEFKAKTSTPTLAVVLPAVTPTPTMTPSPTPTPKPGILTVSAGGPYRGDEGSPISVVAGNFNSVLSIVPGSVTYRWDLDDDGAYDDATGPLAAALFYDEGVYPIGVQAADLIGRVATDTTTVEVENVPPIVRIGPDIFAKEAREIEFAATVNDPGHDVLFFEWDFGDGSKRVNDTLHPEHTYDDNGDYFVLLRVSDNDGGVSEDFLVARVENRPPIVNAGPDQTTNEGEPVTLSGSATDPSELDTLTYAWDLDYDGRKFTPDVKGKTASTTYTDGPANMVAALGVQDDDGGQTIDTVNITVNNVPPVFVSIANDGPAGEGSPLTLEVEATDQGDDLLTYAFDWQNDGSFDAVGPAIASNIWYDEGNYSVGIKVDDGDGDPVFTTTTVSYYNEPPLAIANADRVRFEGDSVRFDASDSSDPGINGSNPADPANDILTYLWNFGDGNTGSGLEVTHSYADNSVYSATLTVTDDSGAADTDSIGITILNANPVANAGLDRTVDEGIQVSYVGTASDPGTADVLSYAWDFDYDGSTFNVDATGASVIWTYPDGFEDPEDVTVALRVRDDDYPYPTAGGGEIGQHIDTLNVRVMNVPPRNVDAGGPYAGVEGQIITLTGDADDVPADTLTYQWDFDYDGTTFGVDAVGQTVTNTWSTAGVYTVRLRVADDDGGASFDIAPADINAVPIADAGGPYSGLEGSLISFDGSNTNDPDGDSLTYVWNFGDGSPATNGVIVTHAYADNGVYTATLTITDDDGASDTDSVAVTILNANPVADAGPDRVATEGVQITLAGTATDPGSADVLTYAWDVNYDGSNFDQDASGASINVTFLDGPAVITAAMRVRDDDYPYPTGGGGEIGEDIDLLQVTVVNAPPIAVAGGPYAGVEGQPVTLTGQAADVLADILTYEWDLDYDGINFTVDAVGQTVINTWATGGVYTVALRVTDDDLAADLDTATVNIDRIPIADAGGPYSGNEGSPITFDGSGSGDPDGDSLVYTWDFGDGSPTANGITATHVYADNGVYTAILQVDDNRGGIATDTASVTVNNLPPTAAANANPNPAPEGTSVTFDGSGSSDPGAGDTLTYEWDFGDGSPLATGVSVNHTYADNAVYTTALTVRDDDGAVDTDDISVTILNVAPVADAGGPYATTVGVPTTLSGNGTDVPADPLNYTWDLDNDGAFETSGQTIIVTWPVTGTYTIALRVEDDEGGFDIDTTTVDVGSPPIADAGGPYSGNEGSPITFDGSNSNDPDGDPLTYTWDFGDGSPPTTGITTTHLYTDNGVYTATLQVDDNRGGIDTDTALVTVDNLPPIAAANANPNPAPEGTVVTFDGSGSSDPGAGDTLTYEWDFGDGSPLATGVSVNHSYADNDVYMVTLTVRDDDGGVDTDTIGITIQNVPPTADAGGPYNTTVGAPLTLTGSATDPSELDTLTFSWELEDSGGNTVTISGSTITFTWTATGTYNATLRVSDDDGGLTTDTTTVQVSGIIPLAWLGASCLIVRRKKIFLLRKGKVSGNRRDNFRR